MSSFIRGVNLCCAQKLRADGRNTRGFQMKLSPEDCVHTDYSCGDEMTACGINCPVIRNERAGGMSFQVFQQKLKGFCVRRPKKTLISEFLSKFSLEYQIKMESWASRYVCSFKSVQVYSQMQCFSCTENTVHQQCTCSSWTSRTEVLVHGLLLVSWLFLELDTNEIMPTRTLGQPLLSDNGNPFFLCKNRDLIWRKRRN